MIYLPLEAVVSIYCDMCKALAQCRACGSCYTKSGRQTGTFRNFFWVFVFPTCHLRGLGNAVLLAFSGIVGVVSILHEIYGIISLKMDFCLSTGIKGMLWIILKVGNPKNWLFLLWNVV